MKALSRYIYIKCWVDVFQLNISYQCNRSYRVQILFIKCYNFFHSLIRIGELGKRDSWKKLHLFALFFENVCAEWSFFSLMLRCTPLCTCLSGYLYIINSTCSHFDCASAQTCTLNTPCNLKFCTIWHETRKNADNTISRQKSQYRTVYKNG